MIERIIKNQKRLILILTKDQKHLQLKSNEVEILEEAVLVLQNFYNITEYILSEFTTTSSLFFLAFTTLIKASEINLDNKSF